MNERKFKSQLRKAMNPKDSQAELREAIQEIFDKVLVWLRIYNGDIKSVGNDAMHPTQAKMALEALFQAREQQLLTELYEQRWIVSLEPGVSKAVISANDIKERLQNKTNDGGSDE